jgi:Kef-type K+ transport system membrane component KefB
LACLLFLAGREIQVERLRGALLATSLAGFAISFALGFGAALALHSVDLIKTQLLLAIIFAATSLSIIIVPLKDAGETETDWGQQVIAAAAIAEFGAVVLLSFFYSGQREASTESSTSVFMLFAALVLLSITRGSQLRRVSEAIRGSRHQRPDRVRGDFALVAVVAAVASQLGLETILAAFTVGVIRGMTSGQDERQEERLDAVALGIFVPFFFVGSGLDFDLGALFGSVSSFIRLPLFVLALLVVRGLPALLYRGRFPATRTIAAGLLQATSLSFIVVATRSGSIWGSCTRPPRQRWSAPPDLGGRLPALAFGMIGEPEGEVAGETPELDAGPRSN